MSISALGVVAIAAAFGGGPLDLSWDAPAQCPDHAVIEQRVLDAVGDTAREKPLSAIGTISFVADATFRLELTIVGDGAAGTRELAARSCEELTDAAVLIIAIAVDPRAIERLQIDRPSSPAPAPVPAPATKQAPRKAAQPEPPPEPVPPPAPATALRADAAPRRRGPLRVDVSIAPGVALGILPAVTGWFAAGVALAGRVWRVELEGNVSTPAEGSGADDTTATGRFLQWTVAARGCPVITTGDVEFPLCLGIEAGAVRGEGVDGVVERRTALAPWVGALGGASVIWRPRKLGSRVGFGLRAEGVAALARPSFETAQSNLVFAAGRGGGRFAAIFLIRLR